MTKEKVKAIKGKPTSIEPARDSDMETWEYGDDFMVLFDDGQAVQVIGDSLMIRGEVLSGGLSLKEVSTKLGVSESSLPSPLSGPVSRSITLKDGTLTIGQAGSKVLNYSLELKAKP